MPRSIAAIIGTLICLAGVAAAGPQPEATSKPTTRQVRQNKDGQFQFDTGPDWKPVPAPGRASILLLSGGDPGPERFQPVLRLDASPMRDKSAPLAEAGESQVIALRRLLKESKVVEEKDVQLAGEPAKSIVVAGKMNDRPMKAKVVYAIHQGRLCLVYFLTREAEYDAQVPEVEKVASSWKWTQ